MSYSDVPKASGDGAVHSVYDRTGAVDAVSGDYTASQVTNVPSGNIMSTEVQAALMELDTSISTLNAEVSTLNSEYTSLNSSKQAVGNYITALTGGVTASGPGSAAATVVSVGGASATSINTAVSNVSSAPSKILYINKNHPGSYVADGSVLRPFKTIMAAVNQVITNADNSTYTYCLLIGPGTYDETVSLNNTALYDLRFSSINGEIGTTVIGTNGGGTGVSSTSNNSQLGTLVFDGIIIQGVCNLTGGTNGTSFLNGGVLFNNVGFYTGPSNLVLNNFNFVQFINCTFQLTASEQYNITNVINTYITGDVGQIKGGAVINLVTNGAANKPAGFSFSYLRFHGAYFNGTINIDSASRVDFRKAFFYSSSAVVNNGILQSFGSHYDGTITCNNGSTNRFEGDTLLNDPTVNAGATVTYRSSLYANKAKINSSIAIGGATSATNAVMVYKDGHIKSTQTTAPTIAVNANAGSGASASLANATDAAGKLTIVSGSSGVSTGSYATLTFNKAYNTAPIVTVTPASAIMSPNVYVTSTTSGFDINFSIAANISSTYVMNYNAVETQ